MRRSAILAAAALLALPAAAGAGSKLQRVAATAPTCSPATSKLFEQFGDAGLYFVAPGGTFEGTANAWALSGQAAIATGNETFFITGPGTTSLKIAGAGTATSAPVCISAADATVRFLIRNTGAAAARLALDVTYTRPDGVVATTQVASLAGTSTWSPTPVVYYLANVLALFSTTGTANVAFGVRALDSKGIWQIDDFSIDPYKRV